MFLRFLLVFSLFFNQTLQATGGKNDTFFAEETKKITTSPVKPNRLQQLKTFAREHKVLTGIASVIVIGGVVIWGAKRAWKAFIISQLPEETRNNPKFTNSTELHLTSEEAREVLSKLGPNVRLEELDQFIEKPEGFNRKPEESNTRLEQSYHKLGNTLQRLKEQGQRQFDRKVFDEFVYKRNQPPSFEMVLEFSNLTKKTLEEDCLESRKQLLAILKKKELVDDLIKAISPIINQIEEDPTIDPQVQAKFEALIPTHAKNYKDIYAQLTIYILSQDLLTGLAKEERSL